MFTRIASLAFVLALVVGVSLGCDNRSKTEKALDAAKEKLKAGMNKLSELKNQKEFVSAAEKKVEESKSKLDELIKKAKEANPEAAKKIDEQIAALKKNISSAEDAIKKAAAEPEKTWESVKAKALDAMKQLEADMAGQ